MFSNITSAEKINNYMSIDIHTLKPNIAQVLLYTFSCRTLVKFVTLHHEMSRNVPSLLLQ